MFRDFIQNINWMDVFLLCVLLRCVFIGAKRGFWVEFLKLTGTLLGMIVAMHYYARLAKSVRASIPTPEILNEILVFTVLLFSVAVVFRLLREGSLLLLRKDEEGAKKNSITGGILGLIRGLYVCGLIVIVIYLTRNEVLIDKSKASLAAPWLLVATVNSYDATYEHLISKVFPDEVKNKAVLRLIGTEEENQSKTSAKVGG